MRKSKKSRIERKVTVLGVTGTPGCGKTELCATVQSRLSSDTSVQFVNVGDLIKERKLFDEWDDEMNCSIFDEKLVNREISKIISQCDSANIKGLILDFHSLGFISTKSVDKIFVLQVETSVLWDRLEKRGYDAKKIQENVQAEIFMESFNEAIDKFGEDIVETKPNNTVKDRDTIADEIVSILTSLV